MSESGKIIELRFGTRPGAGITPKTTVFPRFERLRWCRGDGRVDAWLYLSPSDAVASVVTCDKCKGQGCGR